MKYIRILLMLGLILGLSSYAECAKRKKLIVTVIDRETSVVIPKADVTVITLSNGSEIATDTKSTGKDGQCKFALNIEESYQYKVYVSKSAYYKCLNDSGNSKKVSEVLISNYDDEEIALYLTTETQESVSKHPEQTTKPKKAEAVESETQQTNQPPATTQKEPQKPINQDLISNEKPSDQPITETSQGQEETNNGDGGSKFLVWLIIFGIIAAILWFLKSRYDKKCPKCGKWNAMAVVKKEIVDKQQSTITKVLKTKDAKGQVIKTQEKAVPATIIKYRVHRKCRICGYEDSYMTTDKKEN